MATLVVSKASPCHGALVAVEHLKDEVQIKVVVEDQTDSCLTANGLQMNTATGILRYLARSYNLYGQGALERTEVDYWLDMTNWRLSCATEFSDALAHLDRTLATVTYLVGHSITVADMAVWATLRGDGTWQYLLSQGTAPAHVKRYYTFLSSLPAFKAVDSSQPETKATAAPKAKATTPPKTDAVKKERKDEGKFIELPGAEMGKVVVRFPPEASGFLHVGHAKAALLNQYYQINFKGKLIMRFDDTNPAKESSEFEKVILEDIKLLGLKPDIFTHTSDSFDLLLTYAEKMLKDGTAYVDNTEPEVMKAERDERKDSKNRNNSPQKNLSMWEEMKTGTDFGRTCAVRAKITMNSDNGCMRDPTIYRCKPEPHVRTGLKYKVYPTYDFACPIVDSVEGVTHALRTTEYLDRDEQFYWFLDTLGLRKPNIWAYSRLNLQNTVMSKRKLTWFVQEGLVDGWDDPRLPTVRGVLRRGMTVEGLKQFIIAQGSSRSVVMMDWEKIWAFNKKVIDPVVPRFTALLQDSIVPVNVKGAKSEIKTQAKHPKNEDVGTKQVAYGSVVYIEGADAETLSVGETVTFINWGNLIMRNIKKDSSGKILSIDADLNLENTDFKKTTKLTWLAESESLPLIPTHCIHYEHIISKAVLAKEDDFKDYINTDSKTELGMLGDPELAKLKKGDMIQLQRKGYFICDSPYEPVSRYSGRASPCVLLHIPDGHVKETHKAGSKHKPQAAPQGKDISAKEKAQSKKGKSAEKSPAEEHPQQLAGAVGEAVVINAQINYHGNLVRKLKADKAPKPDVDAAVKTLLELKAEFKKVTGQEWKAGMAVPSSSSSAAPPTPSAGGKDAAAINSKIVEAGDKIRKLKADKAPKTEIDPAVKALLSLKAEFKEATGKDWKPGMDLPSTPSASPAPSTGGKDAAAINSKINEQGDKIRQLKSSKAPKTEIDPAVKALLALKAEFKEATGKDWKPGMDIPSTPSATPAPSTGGKDAAAINNKIIEQGDKIRQLKSSKAPKTEIDPAVKALLSFKAEFKEATGKDWKPGMEVPSAAPVAVPSAAPSAAPAAVPAAAPAGACINQEITQQGDKIRQLKAAKAPKPEIDSAVKVLLSLKADFKNATGQDWKPGMAIPATPAAKPAAPVTPPASSGAKDATAINQAIVEQGDKIRQLKSEKAAKAAIDSAVKTLLSLKADYKASCGQDWKPGCVPPPSASAANTNDTTANMSDEAKALKAKVDGQGITVRDLKTKGAPKDEVDVAVKMLLDLKLQYKELTGEDLAGGGGGRAKKGGKGGDKGGAKGGDKGGAKGGDKGGAKGGKQQEKKQPEAATGGREVKKVTRLGLEALKEDDLPTWYSQVITKAEMIEYYDVSGCYVLRPWSFGIWEQIQSWFDAKIKSIGFTNCYFPIFVSNAALQKEKDHIEDFAPEVAWVTRSGDTELAEPIAVRPTSETVMYPAYSKWVQSHRDLPIKLNQWCNVVRWEFKNPQPFLRTREFLWQEGHSAYATYKEAEEEVYWICDRYEEIYETMLAVPVVKGKKTQKEKFAGGDFTTTVEAFISATGRGIQAATSHHLGQNFSKMFDISFEDPETHEKCFAYQNSWAITTRSIGVLIMVHGDNKGLVLPPRIAVHQAVIVPCGITASLADSEKKAIVEKCQEVEKQLTDVGLRVKGDYRDHYSPGWKFNHWELKGVPLRIEIGARDIQNKQMVLIRRDTGDKSTIPWEGGAQAVKQMMVTIQDAMFNKAKKELDENMIQSTDFEHFCNALNEKKIMLSPFCGGIPCEEDIKKLSAGNTVVEEGAPAMGAKGLCIPFNQPGPITPDMKCIKPGCTVKPQHWTLFGRSY